MSVSLLGGWDKLLKDDEALRAALPTPCPALPVAVPFTAAAIKYVADKETADRVASDLKCLRVRAISIDSEYSFTAPGIRLRSGKFWFDIRTQRPIVLSLAVWTDESRESGAAQILRYVFDVRKPEVIGAIKEILRLRVPFIFHNIKAELFTFWALGLRPDLRDVYDTYLAAASLILGIHHHRGSHAHVPETQSDEIAATENAEALREHQLSLNSLCRQYGHPHPFETQKSRLQNEFLAQQDMEILTGEQIEYAAADAVCTLKVFISQQTDVMRAALAHHLHTIEFPFAIANARIEWNGAYVAGESMAKLRQGCSRAANHYGQQLISAGMKNPASSHQFLDLMTSLNLVAHFTKKTKAGKPSTNKAVLETLEGLHPTIRAYRLFQKYNRLAGEEWLSGKTTGIDQRVHPQHRQLGAHSGRNSCKQPNLAGIGKIFRPIVSAPAGRAIFELDYSQVEVAIAAAEYDDPSLIAAYNSGDVYTYMANQFYKNAITEAAASLTAEAFKEYREQLRDRMKTFVLAVLYNIQAPAIAQRFKISVREAEEQREAFLNLFPAVKRALEESSTHGTIRGYAVTVTGLKRHIPNPKNANQWVRNFLRNTPIQGSAADVFKAAVVAVDRELLERSAQIILIIHDAIVIECALADLDELAAKTQAIMQHTLKAFYPQLRPKVDVNKSCPQCWNKSGHADSLDKFLADPSFTLDQQPLQGVDNHEE